MKRKASEYVIMYVKIILGAALYAFGFQYFTYPNSIVSGGVSGIAMIINYLCGVPVGVMTLVLNIPLFVFSWKKFGLGFLISSMIGTVLSSVMIDVFSLFGAAATQEALLGAIYGGLIKGFGLGLTYTTGATTGGVDIIAKFLRAKYQHINFSTLILLLDVAVIAAFAVIFGKYDNAMYAVICMFVSSKVIDLVLFGAVNSKVCYVITDQSEAVKDSIVTQLHRGVTFLHGAGAWSHQEKDVILCVIKSRQIVELKKILHEIDPGAFMIVSDSHEIFGKGFTYLGSEE